MICLCPHCGANLTPDEPVERDGFRIDPAGAARRGSGLATYEGRALKLTGQAAGLLHTIASAGAMIVAREAVLARLSDSAEDSADPRKLIQAILYKARTACKAAGAPFPIETVWGVGLRWRGTAS